MPSRTPIIERAYELARTDGLDSFTEILRRLMREGYLDVDAHLDGALIRSQLVALVLARKGQHAPLAGPKRKSRKTS